MNVIISEMKALAGYVSREFYAVITDLIENYGWAQIEMNSLLYCQRTLSDELTERLGEMPKCVLVWESYDFMNTRAVDFLRMDCQKCIFADDLHSWDPGMKQRKRNAFLMCDTVFSTYAYAIEEFYPSLSRMKNVVWVPHSASPDFMLPFNDRAENSIFLSGAISRHYSLRPRLWSMHERGAYAIAYHPHPGYHCQYDHEIDQGVGRGYAQKINQCRTAFTDSPHYRYLVGKYFEIPATGALLLAQNTDLEKPLEKLGFVDGVNYIAVSEQDIEEKIEYVLDEKNHAALDVIRHAGQSLIRARHQTSDRARLIHEVCSSRT